MPTSGLPAWRIDVIPANGRSTFQTVNVQSACHQFKQRRTPRQSRRPRGRLHVNAGFPPIRLPFRRAIPIALRDFNQQRQVRRRRFPSRGQKTVQLVLLAVRNAAFRVLQRTTGCDPVPGRLFPGIGIRKRSLRWFFPKTGNRPAVRYSGRPRSIRRSRETVSDSRLESPLWAHC